MVTQIGWYVGFCHSEKFPKWAQKFLKFTHCYCFTATVEGILVIDPNMSFMSATILTPDFAGHFLPNQLKQGHTLLYVERTVDTMQFFCQCTPVNCVAAVKYILGFKSWAQTPYQLYKALKNQGAKEYGRNF